MISFLWSDFIINALITSDSSKFNPTSVPLCFCYILFWRWYPVLARGARSLTLVRVLTSQRLVSSRLSTTVQPEPDRQPRASWGKPAKLAALLAAALTSCHGSLSVRSVGSIHRVWSCFDERRRSWSDFSVRWVELSALVLGSNIQVQLSVSILRVSWVVSLPLLTSEPLMRLSFPFSFKVSGVLGQSWALRVLWVRHAHSTIDPNFGDFKCPSRPTLDPSPAYQDPGTVHGLRRWRWAGQVEEEHLLQMNCGRLVLTVTTVIENE